MINRTKEKYLGQNIRTLRKQKGWTQVDLSKRLGCSQTVIAAYENNRKKPLADKIIQMAHLFDVSYDQLLGASSEQMQQPKKAKVSKLAKMFEEVESLPAQEKTVLIKMIDGLLAKHRK